MKNIPYSLLLLLCCFACNKEDLQNQQLVIDSITKEPIANAKIQLTVDESDDIWAGSSRRLLETVYTDEQGRYKFESSINDREYYHEIFVFADTYFEFSNGQAYPHNKLVELDPEGYIKIRVHKLDTVDYVSGYVLGGNTHSFEGYKIDTTFIDTQRAGNRGSIVCWLRRNGESQPYIDENNLFIPRHDTTFYEIIF